MTILIKGKNKTNAKHAFVMRNNYKYFGMPTAGMPTAIDMWEERPHYGRKDSGGDAIYLSESHLVQIPTASDETIQALDFVVDAFVEFAKEYRAYRREGFLNNAGPFANIDAVKGWPPGGVNSMYRLYQEMMYRNFIQSFLSHRQRKDKVVSLESFMEMFVEYADKMLPEYPITRSGLILSKYSDPMVSGLMIEVAQADHSDDRIKNRVFIKDYNFPIFRKVAAKHGFMIDKNAPWRLVANLNSPKMQEYMTNRGKSLDRLFKTTYYRSYRGGVNFVGNDVTELKIFLYGIYNSLVNSNPTATQRKEILRSCSTFRDGNVSASDPVLSSVSQSSRTMSITREVVTFEDFEQKYDQFFWMKMYMYIRAKENGKTWTDKQFNNKTKKMLQVYKALDIAEALRYINDETK